MTSRAKAGGRLNPRARLARATGLQAVLLLLDFRWLWLGQVFSQLADKFY
ncbi:MAG: MFS transporter, partial [Cyanobium sp.]